VLSVSEQKAFLRIINNCPKWFARLFWINSIQTSVLTTNREAVIDSGRFRAGGAAQLPLRRNPGSFSEYSTVLGEAR
jgi:hypothetical protein